MDLLHYIYYKVWDEITYPFQNFNGTIIQYVTSDIHTIVLFIVLFVLYFVVEALCYLHTILSVFYDKITFQCNTAPLDRHEPTQVSKQANDFGLRRHPWLITLMLFTYLSVSCPTLTHVFFINPCVFVIKINYGLPYCIICPSIRIPGP